jgi:hypothetical protein
MAENIRVVQYRSSPQGAAAQIALTARFADD